MKFTLVIQPSPEASAINAAAFNFARAVLTQGHEIHRLFFYGEGVHSAARLSVAPQDEADLRDRWHQLIVEHELDAVVCIASALKRGIVDPAEAQRYGKDGHSLREDFELAGLGQLVEAAAHSDRVITFGG